MQTMYQSQNMQKYKVYNFDFKLHLKLLIKYNELWTHDYMYYVNNIKNRNIHLMQILVFNYKHNSV